MIRVLVLSLLVGSASSFAADCARPEGASEQGVAAMDARARLAFMAKLFDEESAAAKRWTFGWGGGYALLTAAQLAAMPFFSREEQPDWYWGAASSVVGVAFTLLGPLEVLEAGPRYAQRAATVSDEETCSLIAEGERMLREGADSEDMSRAWYIHLGNVAFGAGMFLLLGLGYQHWVSGAINGAVSVAIGELTIFTMPNQLISGWKRYRDGDGSKATPVSFMVVPTAGPGLGFVMRF